MGSNPTRATMEQEEGTAYGIWGFVEPELQHADGFIGMTVPGTYDPYRKERMAIMKTCLKNAYEGIDRMDDEGFDRFMQRLDRLTKYVTGDEQVTIET